MEKTCHILGSTVHYWDFHSKKQKVIIAVHGFRGTHHGLLYIIKELPEFRIIIPDLPGFGDSTPLKKTPHTAHGYATFLDAFIKQLNLSEPPILLGHSFGSVIASRYVRDNPGSISQLILINPIAKHGGSLLNIVGLSLVRTYYRAGAKLPEKIGYKLLSSRLVSRLTTISLAKAKERHLRERSHHEHLTHFSRFHNRNALNEAFNSSITDTVGKHAAHIPHHTLLIAGGKDAIVPPKTQVELQKHFPKAKLHIIDKTGHLVHYETPEVAAKQISDFLH